MRKGVAIVAAVVLLIIVIFGWFASTRNNLVTADEGVKAQLGQLNNVYQQRSDLIPNLVETVKGAANIEKTTLTDVINARARASSIQLTADALKDPQAIQNFQKAQGELTGALSRLMVVAEQYPQLKSQENFSVLMSQLEGQESRIRIERNRYNETVNSYNTKVRQFPTSLVAGMSGFTQYPYFNAAAGAENAPKVTFGSDNTAGTTNSAPAPTGGGQAPAPATQPHGAVQPAPAR